MAYSTPLTATSNATLTSSQWNASVRDNILVTPAALATTAGQIFVATGANAIAARTLQKNTNAASSTTTSTTYADLAAGAGPNVTVTCGTQVLVFIGARLTTSTATAEAYASFAISDATTVAASDDTAVMYQPVNASVMMRASSMTMVTGLTAGSNTFTMKYRVSAGTGTFLSRSIAVVPL